MKQPFYVCEQCGVRFEHETRVETRVQSIPLHGVERWVTMPLRVCTHCGGALCDTVLDDALFLAMETAYPAKVGDSL